MAYAHDQIKAATHAMLGTGLASQAFAKDDLMQVALPSGHRVCFKAPSDPSDMWKVSLRRGKLPPAHTEGDRDDVRIGWGGKQTARGRPEDKEVDFSHSRWIQAHGSELPHHLNEFMRHPGVVKAIQDDTIASRVSPKPRIDHEQNYPARAASWRKEIYPGPQGPSPAMHRLMHFMNLHLGTDQ